MMYACPMTHTKVCVYALMHAFDCTCDLLYKLYKPAVHFASDDIYIFRDLREFISIF